MNKLIWSLRLCAICAVICIASACSESTTSSATTAAASNSTSTPAVFIKAEPAVDAVLNRPPRTLRIFLTELPDVSKSSVKLSGNQGDISLSHFHTMGADDLMIEIDDHPLPNGEYTVEWTATVGEDARQYNGKYNFTVAVED